jgi:hypothetical protein
VHACPLIEVVPEQGDLLCNGAALDLRTPNAGRKARWIGFFEYSIRSPYR